MIREGAALIPIIDFQGIAYNPGCVKKTREAKESKINELWFFWRELTELRGEPRRLVKHFFSESVQMKTVPIGKLSCTLSVRDVVQQNSNLKDL